MSEQIEEQLTVEGLIKELETIEDKSKVVDLEGCDCYGDAGSIDEDEDAVHIMRASYE